MGEYIKHRSVEGEEIKLGVTTGDGFKDYDIVYPKEMLQEFLYLGYEDYYGGFNETNAFLKSIVDNFEQMEQSWGHNLTFEEIISDKGLTNEFIDELLADCNLLQLHREGEAIFVISAYYHDEVFEKAKTQGITIELIPYQYQHKNQWIRTDDLQFVRKDSESEYTVIETTLFNDEYVVQEVYVNLSDYSDEELEGEVDGYYNSLEFIKEEYKDAWKQIVAEIIAEQTQIDNGADLRFKNEEEIHQHLKGKYGINAYE